MTSPTREAAIARIIDPDAWNRIDRIQASEPGAGVMANVGDIAKRSLIKASEILSLFPEGRSEQDHDCGHFEQAMANGEALAAARLRIKALETENEALLAVEGAARNLPRETPAPGGAGTEHPFMIAAAHVWDNDRALGQLDKLRSLSSAQGETKEGFDGLPELPCGERDEPTGGATAALAWLAENQNCELSFDYGDADEDGDGWRVHRVNGGVNDREWTLIGTGPTPEAAIVAATGGAR